MEEKTKTIGELMQDLVTKYKLDDLAITEKLKTVPYHSFNYDNGYYVPRKHPEGFGKGKSKYCLERSDSGWESVIVSGRNPGINHPAGTSAAKECDEFVKSGEWILAEVEQVVEG